MLWLLACLGGGDLPPAAQEVPRTAATACARLEALGATCACEGGPLGDEISLLCEGTWQGAPYTVGVVTTGVALPPPAEGVGAHHGDVQVEVEAGARSRALYDGFVR